VPLIIDGGGIAIAMGFSEVREVKTAFTMLTLTLVLFFPTYLRAQEETSRSRGTPYEQIIIAAAARYEIDPHLLWTIAYLESRFRPSAVSHKDGKPCARGLMQFIPSTARQYGLKDPHDVPAAVDAGARYLRDLLKRFGGRRDLALAAYNAGEGTVDAYRNGTRLILQSGKIINPNGIRTGGVPPYHETRDYVARGTRIYQSISGRLLSSQSETGRKKASEVSVYILNHSSTVQEDPPAKPVKVKSPSLYAN
jgi:soluble lytic murein transglycosylase-like protein